jgi:DNA polymerase III subunit gamma/tau
MVGQEPVVRTLRNAVEQGKVHHAYLFVGSRGTGKTSTAKILAACLNCERGPTTEPCGTCESCLAIASATSLDVIEMDAASNNSVDDIRELRESVAYAPVSGRQKIYILDEAHMLSQAAWNAFLKTLEEPPESTVFVLATTEAQKVPPTVIDRCHRFDFHRPTVEQIASVVRRVAKAEQVQIPPPAVAAIARSATGSFRDALGTLEQLVTYSGQQIELADVLAVLGVADSQLLDEVFDSVRGGDTRQVLLAIGTSVESGRDASSFASDLEVRARELLVVQTLQEVPEEMALTPEDDERLAKQAADMPRAVLVRMLELLAGAMEAMRAGADSRTQLELALLKAASPEIDSSVTAVLSRIERLERKLQMTDDGLIAPGVPPPTISHATPLAPAFATDASTEALRSGSDISANSAPEVASVPPGASDLEALCAAWPAVVSAVRSDNALLGAVIGEARPQVLTEDDLTLSFASTAAFLKKKAEDPANRRTVSEALRRIAGRTLRLSYELREELPESEAQTRAPTEEEVVALLMSEFDAEELPHDGSH